MKMQRYYKGLGLGLALALTGCIEQTPLPQAPQFQHTYGDEANEVAGAAYPLFGGGYLLVGGSQDPQNRDYDLYIVKVDAAGNQIFARRFGERDRDEVGWKITRIATGEYAILGTSRKTDGGTSLIQITLLDPNLDLRWQSSSTTNVPNYGLTLHSANFYEMPDGHYIAGFGTTEHPVVMRFDSRGTKVDETVHTDYSGSEYRHLFARDAQGHFATFAEPTDYSLSGAYFAVLHYDSLGNYTHTQLINKQALSYGQLMGVTGLSGGGYALMVFDNGIGQYGLGFVDGSTQSLSYLPITTPNYYNNLLELSHGDLLAFGFDGSQYSYGPQQSNFDATVLDSSFAARRTSSYGGQGIDRLRDAAASPTGALLLGETDGYGAGGTDLYVVFLNN